MKLKKQIAAVLMGTMIISASENVIGFSPVITSEAHSGRTDARGGHKDNKNKSGLGSYHYHCGGHPAHLHSDGVCPYSSNSTTTTTTETSKASTASSTDNAAETVSASEVIDKATIMKVQEALNNKGYDCGTADGIAGKKTKAALEKFQKDNQLTVDGTISKEVLKLLEITENKQ